MDYCYSFLNTLVNPGVTDVVDILVFLNAHFSFFSLGTDWIIANEKVEVLDGGCIIPKDRGFTVSGSICGYSAGDLGVTDQGGFLSIITSFRVIEWVSVVVTGLCYTFLLLRVGLGMRRHAWVNTFAVISGVLSVVSLIVYINMVNNINILSTSAFNTKGPGFIFNVFVITISFSILSLGFYKNFDNI